MITQERVLKEYQQLKEAQPGESMQALCEEIANKYQIRLSDILAVVEGLTVSEALIVESDAVEFI